MLREFQDAFHQALLDGDDRALRPALVVSGVPLERRLAVHRNTFYGFLAEALAAAFPVVARLVGTEFFRAAAAGFVRSAPPAVPQLSAYGGDFAAFLAAWAPAQALPYLPDTARLEWARVEAGFAADAVPLTAAQLAAVPEGRYPGLRFQCHPSLRVIASPFPIQSLWQAHQSEPFISPDPQAGAETVLVLRREQVVGAELISAADARLLTAFADGASLAAAAAQALAVASDFDLQAALVAHLRRGSFCGFI